ncbi:ExeM/NucH family extracellular endonuclease [Moritella sp. JT01]|uniref:ExeM/NucH family extracellular endonuclease n=1 Tax=Moritella sp. JT01 TaxID=756698 RepID=UPI001D173015|nr:ExeM/NucH family extracellular endonuclease [Moritella sp. JT01]
MVGIILLLNGVYANELLNKNNISCIGENQSISQLQGEGHRSPYVIKKGSKRYRSDLFFTVKGVVTKLKLGRNAGFFMQQIDKSTLSLASKGIFVRTTDMTNIKVDTNVCVTGVVEEYYGMTQLHPTAEVIVLGDAKAVAPTNIVVATVDANFRETLERYEGMRVRLVNMTDMRVTKPLYYDRRWQRYNIILSHQQINIHPNTAAFPSSIFADQHALNNKQRRLYLQLSGRPTLITKSDYIRVNDKVAGVVGILQFSYGEFRLVTDDQVSKIQFTHLSDRETLPPRTTHHLRIASFNLLNYFNTVAGGTHNPLRQNRGATTRLALHRQETKLVKTIVTLDADFIGLMEIENNGFGKNSAIQRLLSLVNRQIKDPDKQYKMLQPDQSDLYRGRYLGSGAITVAGFYRPSKLQHVSTRVIDLPIQRSILGNAYHRPALTPTFMRDRGYEKESEQLTISVNHFKSKGSKCVADKQRSAMLKKLRISSRKNNTSLQKWQRTKLKFKQDRQGHCAGFRSLAASVLAQSLARLGGDKIILGDLNSYPKEDPLLVLTDYKQARYAYYKIKGSTHSYLGQQLIDLKLDNGFGYHDPFINENTDSWTYSFQALGRLDYILVNTDLLSDVVVKKVWHINAAESRLLNKDKGFLNKIAFSSDHDPLFIELK